LGSGLSDALDGCAILRDPKPLKEVVMRNSKDKPNTTDPTTATKAMEPKSRADFVDEIFAAYKASIESILRTGDILNAAKKALGHGQFGEMVKHDLPFTASTAERLMKIASDERLSNPAHVQLLPAAWGTLYELSKLPDAAFEQALSSGAINPRMTRGNAVKLLAAPSNKNNGTPPSRNNVNKVQRTVQALYAMACDAKVDWTHVNADMVHGLIEEMRSRLDANNTKVAEAEAQAA
jgi:hypothetical protein